MEFVEHQALFGIDRRAVASSARLTLPYFTGKALTDVTTRDVQNMIASLRLHDRTPATANRYRAFLSRLYSWSIERGYATDNPVTRVRRFREPRAEPRILTPEDARALLKAADHRARLAIVFALYTGGRRGELRKLVPADIDLTRHLVRFRRETTKSRRERHVPIHPALFEVIVREGLTEPARPFVLERIPRKVGGYRRGLERARDLAGLPWVTWITLRHTFSGWYLTNGGTLAQLQLYLGHVNPMTTMIYRHFLPDHGQDTIRFIGPPVKASRRIDGEE